MRPARRSYPINGNGIGMDGPRRMPRSKTSGLTMSPVCAVVLAQRFVVRRVYAASSCS